MRAMLAATVLAMAAVSAGAMDVTIGVPLGAPSTLEGEMGLSPWAPGLTLAGDPGEVLLPVRRVFVPVPPGSSPSVEARALDVVRTPVPDGGWARAPMLVGTGLETAAVPAPPRRSTRSRAELVGVSHLMGVPVAVVDVCPLSSGSMASWASRVELTVSVRDRFPAPRELPPEALDGVLAGDGPVWGGASLQWPESPFWGRPWARLAVGSTGGYRVTVSDLEDAGCSVSGAPVETLRMLTGPAVMFGTDPSILHTPQEVAIEVEDLDGNGLFDGSDNVRFLARGIERWIPEADSLRWMQHRYATHNVYWLTWGGESGERVALEDASPDGSPAYGLPLPSWSFREEELQYQADYETRTGWVWEVLEDGETFAATLELPRAGSWDLEARMLSLGTGTTTVRLSVDGQQVAQETWTNRQVRWVVAPDQPLQPSNQVEVSFSIEGGVDPYLAVDLFKVRSALPGGATDRPLFPGLSAQGRYTFSMEQIPQGSRVYDVTDFLGPVRLGGVQPAGDGVSFSATVGDSTRLLALAEGDWRSPDSIGPASPGRILGTLEEGDRLFVAPPSLFDGVWGLAQISEEAGLVPAAVTTREVYDEFNAGVTDPGAIRSAVRWGQDELSPGVEGLVLVGNGHWDVRMTNVSNPSLIPPYTLLGNPSSGEGVCSDDFYVMTHSGDVLPEMPVGRIPAEDATDLASITAKSLAYAEGASAGNWVNRMIFLADDEWGNGMNQSETVHTIDCEKLAEDHAPRYAHREKVYLIEYPWPSGGGHPEKEEAREDLIMEYSRGSAFMAFIGHGSPNQITNEKVLRGSDVPSLTNGARLPLTYWGTCNVGQFDIPGSTCIGGRLVASPEGGGVASVAATRGTFSGPNYSLGAALIDSLYGSEAGHSMGTATWLAKINNASYTGSVRYYAYLGHPDLWLMMPDTAPQLALETDTTQLLSGQSNSLRGDGFAGQGLAAVEVRESSVDTVYTTLGGNVINWRKPGGPAYRGTVALDAGGFDLEAFIPLQSRTGDLARAAATYLGAPVTSAAALDPQPLAEGDPPEDFSGPEIQMWARGYRGVEEPRVSGEVTLEAELSDSSGICFLGGDGRSITLFLDGQGIDVSREFSYQQGSSTSGSLEAELEQLSDGWHTIILRCYDGVGNMSMDTLRLESLQGEDLAIQQALVYPNPGSGRRCFSFRVTADAFVRVSIYTVAGRRIRTLSADCSQGYNQIMWDGLDAEGDRPATGSYVYRIEAVAAGSSVFDTEAEEMGVLAVVEGG